MPTGRERAIVENPLLRYAEEAGWASARTCSRSRPSSAGASLLRRFYT
jgi:hypothetical protein